MSEYLVINILIIAVPLILSFEKKIQFISKLPFVLISIIITGGVYILWDVIATARGDWAFNPVYISGLKIFNLPIEEILFFITVPYACLFIYETGKLYLKENEIKINKYIFYSAILLFFVFAFLNFERNYTFLALFSTGLFLLSAKIFTPFILKSKIYWLFIAFSFIPFFTVNYILTSLPIVTYSSDVILGIRITTIPLEDFFYSYSMLSFYLLFYLIAERIWLKRKKSV